MICQSGEDGNNLSGLRLLQLKTDNVHISDVL